MTQRPPSFVALIVVFVVVGFGPDPVESREGPWTSFPSAPEHPDGDPLDGPVDPPGEDPVLVVAGWGSLPTDIWYWPLFFQLWASGYNPSDLHAVFFGYTPFTAVGSPAENARILADRVEDITEGANQEVDLIAHSMGGLAARWYVEKMNGGEHVDDLIMMGTPHRGNNVSYLFTFTAGARAMHPGSTFYERLDGDAVAPSVDYHNLWSWVDDFYVNRYNAKLPGELRESQPNAREVRYSWVPHLLLPAATYGSVAQALD